MSFCFVAARKAGRSVVSICRLDSLPSREKWVVDATDPTTLESEAEGSATENSEDQSEGDNEEIVSGSEDESYHEPPTKKKKEIT